MENMIEIKGKQVSEDTIVEALRRHIGFEEKKRFKSIYVDGTRIAIRGGWRYSYGYPGYPIAIQLQYQAKADTDTEGVRNEAGLTDKPYNTHAIGDAKKIIKAIQSAIDYIENK